MGVVLGVVLDLVGVAALCAFAWFIWPPAALLVLGVAILLASWRRSRGES